MEFARKVKSITHTGVMSYALLAAKEIGIFEVLMEAKGSLTSSEVAVARKLKERYVRELLGFLCSACLVKISSDADGVARYFLPPEAKVEIDKGILSTISQLKILMSQYQPVLECFPSDGPKGVRFGNAVFECFDEMNKSWRDEFMFNLFLDKVPGLRQKLEEGIQVMEFGSASGHLLSRFALKFPNSHFTVSDCDNAMVSTMKQNFDDLPNMSFETFDLCGTSPLASRKMDWVLAVQVIHNLPHPRMAMETVWKALRPDGGTFTMLDSAGPSTQADSVGSDVRAFLYTHSTFMCIPESYQVDDSEAYGVCWGEDTAVALLKQAGFSVDVIPVSVIDDNEAIYNCRKMTLN